MLTPESPPVEPETFELHRHSEPPVPVAFVRRPDDPALIEQLQQAAERIWRLRLCSADPPRAVLLHIVLAVVADSTVVAWEHLLRVLRQAGMNSSPMSHNELARGWNEVAAAIAGWQADAPALTFNVETMN